MTALLDTVDPEGLLEYSVVFTDRSLNHMSQTFRTVMTDIGAMMKEVYHADAVAIIPGGGTYAMEAVARQFAQDAKVLVVRNGWFSFRWSQILDAKGFGGETTVMKARAAGNAATSPFAPAPIEEVTARILAEKPDIVFAPHVETSAGIILPDEYVTALAAAAHEVGALMVLDCIASGCIWVDMKATGVDVLISAPQKGWSASPSAGVVMMSDRAVARMEGTSSNSFAVDLNKWHQIMLAYEGGGHAYHATMPTDALRGFRDTMLETREYGFEKLKENQWALGRAVRALLAEKGVKSVAAEGFGAPGVVVSYTDDPDIQNGSKFAALGMQIAAGVPLQVDEPAGFMTFRLGLFGLDKLYDVEGAVARLRAVVDQVFP
ncbi:aminotransferase class V-fold PLP-dependent enzyme [Roseobacter sp. HKCCD9010]|uniref:aminotransferase class V-fold PLP-dependent enzyme n=1 Tax=unclassified Roseobacter TaxID=196798 RepID=UPI001490FE97|nr:MULTISPECIES: aminotransferase class V-fold PLP-dependent enzyme [unclassified Roseobacter]MBF9049393.1 aminotransferase class V-fold PLP-dependent enzyme [Rhodobacterales bacterium HKCCD4356]NNV11393.1 aminotransferase class V-fold PLP-dependent enzyme [Roseobacter sp. HKCCD7357]NNV15577.1 aminotransferase class V-fold PLP-dependent enzyme [Roseobacter sp. HKCCD8768]NNV25037.1 aminotransferase class V-fold PLP-dependent enzyme [Roseobacter sp. HKCCD8192]NNV29294.1 aminotransferase class V-